MPDAVLLFGNDFDDFRLVYPNRNEILGSWSRSTPSLSRDGNMVAWGREIQDESVRVVPPEISFNSSEFYDTPLRAALAVHSVAERKVRMFPIGRPRVRYGDPEDDVGDTAISPDGSKVAFGGCATACPNEHGIFILEIATGKFSLLIRGEFRKRNVLHPSWSRDGTRLVFQQNDDLAVFDMRSKAIQVIAKGRRPAWSPSGDWIAYFDESGEKCLLIRPDGTGQKTVKSLGGALSRFIKRELWFSDAAVWSPDGKKLLLNVYAGETLRLAQLNETMLVDLETGKSMRMRRHGSHVYGWAAWKPR